MYLCIFYINLYTIFLLRLVIAYPMLLTLEKTRLVCCKFGHKVEDQTVNTWLRDCIQLQH